MTARLDPSTALGMTGVEDHRSADLGAFRRCGRKAILYQGRADPVVSAYDAIAYYERVHASQGSQSATDSFLRLFMIPGMAHCARGSDATNFGNQGGEAPVCDAEHDARYAGSGNPDDAASYACR